MVTEVIREEIRDTVLLVEKDKALLRALVECDSMGQAHIRQILEYEAGRNMQPPRVNIQDNVLDVTAQVDSFTIYMQLKDRYTEIKDESRSVERVEVNRLTRWQSFRIGIGNSALILLFLAIIYFIKKQVKK